MPKVIIPSQQTERPVARFPSLASSGQRDFIVGNDIMLFDGSMVPASPLFAAAIGERSLGKPDGRFHFIRPKAFADASGRLHVVWGEPTAAPEAISTLDWPPEPITALWTAAYEDSKGWTRLERLILRSAISWGDASSHQSRPSRSEGFGERSRVQWMLAVPTVGGSLDQPILILWLDRNGWHTSSVSTQGSGNALYPSVTISDTEVTLAYIAANVGASHDQNSVFVRRSTDSGEHWGPAKLVSLSGTHPAFEAQLLHGGGATVHLIWLQQDATDDVSVLRHVISLDRGETWSSPTDLGPPAKRQSLRGVVDACQTLHVVVENLNSGADARGLEYASWRGSWSTMSRPFPSLVSVGPDLRLGVSGMPLVAFLARPRSAPAASPMITLISGLEPRR